MPKPLTWKESKVAHTNSWKKVSPRTKQAYNDRRTRNGVLRAADLKGMIGLPVTPMAKNGDIDTKALRRCVDFAIGNDFRSIGVAMHVGESLSLTQTERKLVTEVAVDAANGRVPVLVHTSCAGTRETIELSKHSQDVGADGVVVIVPYHWRPDEDGIRLHFTSISRAIDIGLVGYNFPERIGVSFPVELVAELAESQDNFIGLKDASFNMQYFADVCRVTADKDFAVFAGLEYLIPSMALGGTGSMSIANGIAPKMVMNLYSLCKKREFARARPLQYKMTRLLSTLRAMRYTSAVKAAMAIMGRPVGPSRSPNQPLNREETKRIEKLLDGLGITDSEPHGW